MSYETTAKNTGRAASVGVLYALGAFGTWGLVVPIHFKLLASVPAPTILAHRIVWASLLVLMLLLALRRAHDLVEALRSPRIAWLGVSSVLVGANWLIFIWAVNTGQLVQTSLGYFINPLVSVALGVLVLGEMLRPLQIWACVIAAAGVLVLVVFAGTVPWVALTLAFCFGFYGLIRKSLPFKPLVGFCIECLVLLPIALGYLFMVTDGSRLFPNHQWIVAVLLVTTGLTTAAPLIWFAAAAQRLQLSTVGLLQFLSPICSLALGTLVYGEPFTPAEVVAFTAIWIALALYSADALTARPSTALSPEEEDEAAARASAAPRDS
jgi:chloramphenicol-sensitive protein RarD